MSPEILRQAASLIQVDTSPSPVFTCRRGFSDEIPIDALVATFEGDGRVKRNQKTTQENIDERN